MPASLVFLVAVELLHLSTSTAALIYLLPSGDSPFRSNQHHVSALQPGDLSLLGGVEPTEWLGPFSFTTDELGFRKTPGVTPQNARVLAVGGRSFLYGAALSDDQTLAATLTRAIGLPVYDGGRYYQDPDDLPNVFNLLSKLPRVDRVVILVLERMDLQPENLARNLPPSPGPISNLWHRFGLPENIHTALRRRHSRMREQYHWLLRRWNRFKDVSILLRIAGRLQMAGQKTGLLIPQQEPQTQLHVLRDGQRLLALSSDTERLANPPDEATLNQTADAVQQWCVLLDRRRYKTTVVLVPDKLTVYAPLLRHPPRNAGLYLSRLDGALRQRGLDVINPAAAMREQTSFDTQRHTYYLDDTHWTPFGVRVVADLICESIRRSLDAVQ